MTRMLKKTKSDCEYEKGYFFTKKLYFALKFAPSIFLSQSQF